MLKLPRCFKKKDGLRTNFIGHGYKICIRDQARTELWKYNSTGRKVYYRNSNGFWERLKYDSRGNRTQYKNSEGFWSKRNFDLRGNQTNFKSSDTEQTPHTIKIKLLNAYNKLRKK